MTETDKLFIQQNAIKTQSYKAIKLDSIRSHLPFKKFEDFQIFLNGKTLFAKDGDTMVFIEDFENFLNGTDHKF